MNPNLLPQVEPTGNELVVAQQDSETVAIPLYKALALAPPTIAAVPTGFTATAISDTEIDLAWSGSGDNYIAEYNREDNNSWQKLYSGATASFSVTDLYGDEHYYFRVKSQVTGEYDSDWVYADETTLSPP